MRTTTLERALPQLLEKILARGDRAMVLAGSEERVEALNAALWTYDDRGFLPHGSVRDGFEEDQPIWLATADRNPNGAKVLVLTDGAAATKLDDWTLVLEVFDGNDDGLTAAARARWKEYRAAGHKLTYWRQDDSGRWEQG